MIVQNAVIVQDTISEHDAIDTSYNKSIKAKCKITHELSYDRG